MPFSKDLKQTLKTTLMLTAALPLIACIESDEESEVAVSGELNTSNLTASVELASAGLSVSDESSEAFSDSLSSNTSATANSSDEEAGIAPRLTISDSCAGGGTFTTDINEGSFVFSFSECVGADQGSIDGAMAASLTSGNFDELLTGTYSLGFNVDYRQLAITSPEQEVFSFDGSMDIEMDFTPNQWTLGLDSNRFQYQGPLKAFTLEEFQFEAAGTITNGEQNEDGSWNYDYFITNEDGTFHVKSLGNVTYSTEYPEEREGSLQIEGTNAILTINLVSNGSGGIANLSLDIGKNGVVDAEDSITQAEFYED